MARQTPIGPELMLRHLTVDEALPMLEEYLHAAYLTGLTQVRIVHGKGTGTLRDMVVRRLKEHPLVTNYRPGGSGEGSAGVTVATLAED
ncbi:Smr/MutS family protein [Chloroflexota bacterium]